ncbi:MAG: alpha/beta fold hydrolase [Paracoccaceae bacterium]
MTGGKLATIVTGEATDRPPLLIAHGLFGSARNWGVLIRRLADDRQVIAVDMRNHGDSFRSDDHSYPALAGDLAQAARPYGQVDLLGHSMGGKAAMVLALGEPALVRRLIVADIAPVAYSHSRADLVAAMQALDLNGLTRRGEADARLKETIPDAGVRAFLLQSLDFSGDAPRWKLNLPSLSANMDNLTGFPPVEGRFGGAVLFLSGAASDYVKPGHRAAVGRLFPKAHFQTVPGAGHWLHAEKPREVEAAVRVFLA